MCVDTILFEAQTNTGNWNYSQPSDNALDVFREKINKNENIMKSYTEHVYICMHMSVLHI